ncbi:hypothetical protein [Streptomyces regalis]|uniref:hypothetical protein n=1 Tax=Streptomyces regalis TaxID=68262 RepID=UPI001ABF4C15|nr:hypothetical protein [Streptomyces regalis]
MSARPRVRPRFIGGSLGVAVLGSVYANRLTATATVTDRLGVEGKRLTGGELTPARRAVPLRGTAQRTKPPTT